MIGFGWRVNHIPACGDRVFWRSMHADIGYLILMLMVIRLVWRWINPLPALPVETTRWQRIAARLSHAALYGYVNPRGNAGLGAFRGAQTGPCRLVRAVPRAAVHLVRQGGRWFL